MRFLADMGVAQRIVEWLRVQGHDAVHLRDQGLQRMPNGEIFRKAASEGRTILTFDLDFGEIVALSGGQPVSVVLFRLHNTRAPHVIDRLNKVLKHSTQALEEGAIVVVEEGRHRPSVCLDRYFLTRPENWRAYIPPISSKLKNREANQRHTWLYGTPSRG